MKILTLVEQFLDSYIVQMLIKIDALWGQQWQTAWHVQHSSKQIWPQKCECSMTPDTSLYPDLCLCHDTIVYILSSVTRGLWGLSIFNTILIFGTCKCIEFFFFTVFQPLPVSTFLINIQGVKIFSVSV